MPACLPACPLGLCRGHESNRDNFCQTMDAVEAALGETEGPYFLAGGRGGWSGHAHCSSVGLLVAALQCCTAAASTCTGHPRRSLHEPCSVPCLPCSHSTAAATPRPGLPNPLPCKCPADFGLVDITFAPFLERIVSSIAYYKGFRVRGEVRSRCCVRGRLAAACVLQCYALATVGLLCTARHIARVYWGVRREVTMAAFNGCCHRLRMCVGLQAHTPRTTHLPPKQGRWPNLERWFAAMEARPAYAGFKSDHYTHVHDLPPQLGGCVGGEPGWLGWLVLPLQIGCATGCGVWCMAAGLAWCARRSANSLLAEQQQPSPCMPSACCKLHRPDSMTYMCPPASQPLPQSRRPSRLRMPLTARMARAGGCRWSR